MFRTKSKFGFSLPCGIGLSLAMLAVPQVQAQPYGLSSRPVVGPFLNGALPRATQTANGWQVVEAFPNVTFDDPVTLVPEPGTNRLFVCERQGKIYSFVNNPTTATKTLFLDLSPVTQGYDDCGLIGLAFHPDWRNPASSNRGYVYVYYQFSESPTSGPSRPPSATPGFNRLSRFTVPDGSSVANRASELVLINQYDRHVWHNGGAMFFGPDGFLYLSNGDEGAANDSYNQSQEINSGLFSGVLRIDVDKNPSRSHPIRRQPRHDQAPPSGWTNRTTYSSNYFIPNDNPWLDAGGTVLEEFYAIGLRSPHRMTYDPPSGRIWLGDIGQGTREEIDVIARGGNYQWGYREGSITGPKSKPSPLIGFDAPPVYDYGRSAGDTCVIGGYVYRGLEFADTLYGKYIFGDNTSGRIWAMTYDGTNAPAVVELLDTGWPNNYAGLSSFGVDHNNELYICKMGRPSKIYKLARTGTQPPAPPALLSQTGVFTNLATLSPSAAFIPYDVNSPLWSDGAQKRRWVAVPNDGAPYGANETVSFAATGEWGFPVGTVLVKHFEIGINEANPAAIKRLETRLLVHATNNTWYGLTYKWRPDHSDADLLPGGLLEEIAIQTTSTVRTQTWQYPSRQDCLTCHNETANHVLGVKTRQLNGNVLYPATGVTDNQLRAWSHVGLFNAPLVESNISTYARMVPVTDLVASPEFRVRSYLDANCAHCHRPDGVAALFDARFDTPLTQQGLINGAVVDPLGIPDAKIVAPQSTAKSLLFVRDAALGNNQMPPLAKNVVDTNYISVLAEWINSMPLPPLPPLPPPSVLGRIGNTNTSATSDNIWDNGAYINAGRFTAASNLTVAFIHANVLGITGRYQCAIYTDNANQPATLLVSSLAVTNPVTGWQKLPLPAPLTLVSNTSYWLAIWSDSASAKVFYNNSGGTLRWGQHNFTNTWPNPLSTSGGNNFNYNLYASGGAAPAFVSTPTNRTLAELTTLTVTNLAADADAPFQKISYTLVNPPSGATISSNGVITWTPSAAQGPSTNLMVTVANDGVVAITNSFQVIVTDPPAQPVLVNFAAAPTNGLVPLTVSFTNLTTGASSYAWTFGDGNTSSNTHPANTYSNAGTYSVTLTAISASSTNALTYTNLIVATNPPPPPVVVNFAATPTTGLVPLTVNFTNLTTGASSYVWAFGDGNASSNTHPVNTYSNAGIYSVTLTTIGASGTNALTYTNLIVATNPLAAPVAHSQSLTNAEDTTLPILLTGTDPDGPGMNFVVVTNPVHGNLTGTEPNLTYVPDTNFFGSDSLTFLIHDGSLTSALANVFITITNVNDAPNAQPDLLVRWMSQGLNAPVSGLLTNDTDADNDLLSFNGVVSPTSEGATVTFSNDAVRYWPAFGNSNADAFSYLVSDSQGGVSTGLVTVTTQADPPITEWLGIATSNGGFALSFTGVPGFTYTVQYSDTLEPASWQNLGTATADELGNVQIEDSAPGNGPARFYRAVRGIVP